MVATMAIAMAAMMAESLVDLMALLMADKWVE